MADLKHKRTIGNKLAKLTGIAAVFAAGMASHWLYLNGSAANNFVVAGLQAKFSAQDFATKKPNDKARAGNAPFLAVPLVATAADETKLFGPSWKAVDSSDAAVLRRQLEKMAERKRLRLAVKKIDRQAGPAAAAASLFFPRHVERPGSYITVAAGEVAPAVAPRFPPELVAAAAESLAVRDIARRANVLLPAALNRHNLALAAMQSQARDAKLAYANMEVQYRQALKSERNRLLRLAAERISLVAAVGLPPVRLAVNRHFASSVVADPERVLKRLASGIRPAAVIHIAVPRIKEAHRIAFRDQKPGRAQSLSVRPAKANSIAPNFSVARNALAAINQTARASRHFSKIVPDFSVPLSEFKLASYAPLPQREPATKVVLPVDPPVKADIALVKEAISAYLKGDMAQGDGLKKRAKDKLTRVSIEWAALRLQPRKSGYRRISKFLLDQPEWPVRKWLHWRAEQALFVDRAAQKYIESYFNQYEPQSVIGNVLLARRSLAKGDKKSALATVRKIWRTKRFSKWLEGKIQKEFGSLLSAEDHRLRSDRHFYKGRYSASLRSAGRGGKAAYAFGAARIVVARGGSPTKAGSKLTAKMRKDATWRYAEIRRLRKAKKIEAAAAALLKEKVKPVSGPAAKAWWEEHRSIARRLLDAGKQELAYKVAAHHPSLDGASFLDGEFYSGFIALRFLNKPKIAMAHFARALRKARTPISRSRAAYWQARAAEKASEPEDAERLYALAAVHSSSYYGQLAGARRGHRAVPIRRSTTIASGSNRLLAIRVVDVLKQAGADKLALHLVVGAARTLTERSQIAALAAVLRRHNDARASLLLGKLSAHRGIELDDIAYPDFGVPYFTRLANSAQKPLVYAITRQESAFQAKAKSHAGAKGLMQMLTSTARRTARRQGIPFDPNRLISDPAFNAQLGAAHLGELMRDHPGSLLLVFAAYNAGGGRVNQWIKAYGDPRKPGIDPIDWVERIPFSETRNYVQRVAENLGVYRSLFGRNDLPYLAVKDLRAYAARR